MIQIDETTRNLLLNNTIHREIILRFPDDDFEITSGNIVSESFELTQSICDKKEFIFGGCVVGKMQIKVIDIAEKLNHRPVNVFLKVTYSENRLLPSETLTPSGNRIIGEQRRTVEYQLFSGKIHSAVKQKNRAIKKLVAYDLMYELSRHTITCDTLTSYVTRRVNTYIEADQFIHDMVNFYFDDDIIDVNLTDSFEISDYLHFMNRTARLYLNNGYITSNAKKGINCLKLLQAYAEMNVGFAVFNGQGNLRFKYLIKREGPNYVTTRRNVDEVIAAYRDLSFEEYVSAPILYASFPYADKSVKTLGNDKTKSCYISDNILTRICQTLTINYVVESIQSVNCLLGDYYCYQPYKADVFSRWWLEPGDRVQIKTGLQGENENPEIIDSFVLNRKIKGINGMSVTIEAKGKEYLGQKEGEDNNAN